MSRTRETYLQSIDTIIDQEKYKDEWESLAQYPIPSWFKKAKFGIFIHWNVFSSPACRTDWYPRQMYIQGSK